MSTTLQRAVESDEVVNGLARLGLTSSDIALATHVNERTVRRWKAGDHTTRGESYDRLTNLRDVVLVLEDSLTRRGVRQWFRAKNRLLDGKRPIDLLAAGDLEAVMRAARAFADGAYV